MTSPQRVTSDRAARWMPRGIAFVAGLTVASGQQPLGWWPAALVGLTVAVVLWLRCRNSRDAVLIGWWHGLGAFLGSLTWLASPFLVDPARHAWMIPFAIFFMCGGLALFWAAAFGIARRVNIGAFGLAALWGTAELVRGYIFTGFPWAMPGYIWLDQAPAQLAALVGPYGLTLLTFGLAAGFAMASLSERRFAFVPPFLVLMLAFAFGAAREGTDLPDDRNIRLRVVQPNAPQREKWDPRFAMGAFERAVDASRDDDVDLVIWPETSVTAPLYAAGPYLQIIAEKVAPARAIVGLNRVEGTRGYNSAILLDDAGRVEQTYDKHHLVPFGEYVPLPWLMERIGLRAMTAKEGYGYSAGPGPTLIDTGAAGQALPLICYEAIFPRDLRTDVRPDWLLQMTNDAWFGTFSGPQQSFAQARFRAIETGLPMVRAANTGISAVVDPLGHIRGSIPLGQAGGLTVSLPAPLPPTLYARIGEWGVIVLLTLFALCGAWETRRLGGEKGD